jgi:hypothetical protein
VTSSCGVANSRVLIFRVISTMRLRSRDACIKASRSCRRLQNYNNYEIHFCIRASCSRLHCAATPITSGAATPTIAFVPTGTVTVTEGSVEYIHELFGYIPNAASVYRRVPRMDFPAWRRPNYQSPSTKIFRKCAEACAKAQLCANFYLEETASTFICLG